MQHQIPAELLKSFAAFLESELGLFFPEGRYAELIKSLFFHLKLRNDHDLMQYMRSMVSEPTFRKTNKDRLTEALTIGESYFFRDGCGFEVLQEKILPQVIQKKEQGEKTLRIWSAGCCRGNEAYSLAILVDQLLSSKGEWVIHILATDINKKFLDIGRAGIFRDWDLRNVADDVYSRYFTRQGENAHQLSPHIRSMVTFAYLNLVEDVYPALESETNALDLILCNNTLYYFSDSLVAKVIKKLGNCLVDGGHLIVSAVEAGYVQDRRLTKALACNVFAKGQGAGSPRAVEAAPPPREKAPTPQETAPLPEQASTPTPQPISNAKALYEEGDFSGCITAINNNPKDEEEKSLLIRAYANLGDLEAAEARCREYLSQDSLAPVYHFLLANILQEQDKPDEAVLELKRSIFLDQNYIMAHFSLAFLLQIQKKLKESQVHRRVVLELTEGLDHESVVPGSEQILVSRLREMIMNMGDV